MAGSMGDCKTIGVVVVPKITVLTKAVLWGLVPRLLSTFVALIHLWAKNESNALQVSALAT